MSKQYPDKILEDALTARGIPWRCLWEIKGPKNTLISWLVAYAVGPSVCIVETFKGGGWQAFTPNASNEIAATVEDVIARCMVQSKDPEYGQSMNA